MNPEPAKQPEARPTIFANLAEYKPPVNLFAATTST